MELSSVDKAYRAICRHAVGPAAVPEMGHSGLVSAAYYEIMPQVSAEDTLSPGPVLSPPPEK